MLPIRDSVVTALTALVKDGVALMVRRVEQKRQGHFEHFGDLEIVEPKVERWLHQTDDWSHPIARHRDVRVQLAEDLYSRSCKTDLFPSLSHRGLRGARVPRLGASAGETDLSGVIVEMRRAPREQNRELVFPFYHWNQHGGGPDFPIVAPEMAVPRSDRLDGPVPGEARAQPDFVWREGGGNHVKGRRASPYSTRRAVRRSRPDRNCLRLRRRLSYRRPA